MAAPTDVLNEDVKDLRVEIRESAKELRLDIREVRIGSEATREEARRISVSLAEMKGEFRFIKLFLGMVLAGLIAAGAEFFRLDSRVGVIESRLDKIDTRLDRLDERVGKIETQLDSIQSSLAKLLEQSKVSAKP